MIRNKIVPTLLAVAMTALLSACNPADNDPATGTAGTTPADTTAADPAATTGTPPATDSTAGTAGTTGMPDSTAATTTQADASAAAAGTATTTPGTPVMLNCTDNTRLSVTYSDQPDQATVAVNGGAPVTLAGQGAGTGIAFSGNGYELRGQGTNVTWTAPGGTAVTCTQTAP